MGKDRETKSSSVMYIYFWERRNLLEESSAIVISLQVPQSNENQNKSYTYFSWLFFTCLALRDFQAALLAPNIRS
jgi:hypothetical protein